MNEDEYDPDAYAQQPNPAIANPWLRIEEMEQAMSANDDEMQRMAARVAELEAALEAKRNDPACLNAIASNEPCQPDDTLRRCTICGFIVDVKYKAEFSK